MKIKILIIFFLLFFSTANSKNGHHNITGYVIDNITEEYISKVLVTLMKEDSTIIAKDSTLFVPKNILDNNPSLSQLTGQYSFNISNKGKYIIKAEKEGYNIGYANANFVSQRMNTLFVTPIRLSKIKQITLNEIPVVATKIKMLL